MRARSRPAPGGSVRSTFLAPMATLVVWCILDTVRTGHVTAVGALPQHRGRLVTHPAAGFVGPWGGAGGIAAFPSYSSSYRARTPGR
jgi:Amt family ammonium transporter